jgi:hypothetical protein
MSHPSLPTSLALAASRVAVLAVCLVLVQPASAQVVVAPNTFTTVQAGLFPNSAPFNNQSRYQQIFTANQFSAISGPKVITQIAFRPTVTQAPFTQTFSNIQFNLSTTTQTIAGLSANFASNLGADDTVVRSGSVTLSSANTPGPGSTTAFDILVNLTTPFVYDPALGNLLMDIRDFSAAGASIFVDLGSDPSTSLVFADANPAGVTSGTVQNFGIVTQFTFAAIPAPEPGTMLFCLVGGLGVFFQRQHHKAH